MRSLLASVLIGLVALQAPAACAGALQVSPVGLDLPSGRAAAVLTVRDGDQTPMNVQVRVFRWTQVDGEDHLEPADDVVASPPIAPLAPQTDRMVRIVRTSAQADTEQSYRLIVDELPPPPSTDSHRVQLLLRHSIPLFFGADGASGPKVAWTAVATDQGVTLTALNSGGRHVRISNLKLVDASGATVTERPGLVGYVLAGSEVVWRLPKPAAGRGAAVRLHADGDLGSVDAPLQPAP